MPTILKSLVIYPWKAKDKQAIEAIQRTFTYKITEVQHLNYWERLHELKLYSLQRRREPLYNYIYLKDNTAYGAKYIDGTMGHKITKKNIQDMEHSALFSTRLQKPSTIPSKK